ncbi:MAG: Bug family tripartite tricarboxylate transporter substrate binding protein [Betaproteobacteria bacterium]
MRPGHVIAAALCITAASLILSGAHAQSYPTKPVRFVLGTAPGGSTDTIARIAAQGLSDLWGRNVVVDNRPGAGATIAADLVTKAQPDGYTLFVGGFGPNAMAGSIFPRLSYNPAKDFSHVTMMVAFPNVLIVRTSGPMSNLKEFIAQAKAKPGAIKYGSSGTGGSGHAFLELMNMKAGIKTIHVPYKSGPLALTGMIAGDVDYVLVAPSTALAQLSAGRVRALGVTSATPNPRLPGVPPIASVLPGYEALEFHGLHAPAKTPKHIVAKLHQDIAKVLRQAEIKARLDGIAMDVAASTPADFTSFINSQIKTWAEVARAGNIRVD